MRARGGPAQCLLLLTILVVQHKALPVTHAPPHRHSGISGLDVVDVVDVQSELALLETHKPTQEDIKGMQNDFQVGKNLFSSLSLASPFLYPPLFDRHLR